MTPVELLRLGAGLLLSLAFTYQLYNQAAREGGEEPEPGDHRSRYGTFIDGTFLPCMLLILLGMSLWRLGWKLTWWEMVPVCFQLFLQMSIYFVLLALALPWLRRHISARACGVLWLLPTYLYMTVMMNGGPKPVLLFHLPGNWMELGAAVWLLGFCLVMLWKTVVHLVFRQKILSPASTVTDPDTLKVWEEEREAARMEKIKCRLVCSPKVTTPLSVGLMARTTCVVLPERNYSPQELHLIFRHELIHIGRGDGSNKFFLTFCTALCWFNPLVWFAMARSADDLELSCDETVLEGADSATRRQYADLLLRTAGEERGFTTCLSASASALRYRLTHVMKPGKRATGCVTVGLVFFILFATFGLVGASFAPGTGADYVFTRGRAEEYKVAGDLLYYRDDREAERWSCTDPDALMAAISQLGMSRLTNQNGYLDEGSAYLSMMLSEPGSGRLVAVRMGEKALSVYRYDEKAAEYNVYLLDQPLDLEALGTSAEGNG